MIKAGVIGFPISHSRSPLIHGYWLKQYGIDGRYDKTAVEPEHLKAFIDGMRAGERVGANVTLPHKESAIAFIDEPDERVRRIGALNTIWRENGKLHATSTDGPGFIASLIHHQPKYDFASGPVTIFGAGGSVRAIVDELLRSGVERIAIWNRTHRRAETLAHHFGAQVHAIDAAELPRALSTTHLLINTTSAGLKGEAGLDIPWDALTASAVVADIVYTPLITPFLKTATAHGHVIVPGLGMLLHQAVVGFEKWFGVKPEVTQDLHDLVARDIDPDDAP
jgi:shikimate dehydrogenase